MSKTDVAQAALIAEIRPLLAQSLKIQALIADMLAAEFAGQSLQSVYREAADKTIEESDNRLRGLIVDLGKQ